MRGPKHEYAGKGPCGKEQNEARKVDLSANCGACGWDVASRGWGLRLCVPRLVRRKRRKRLLRNVAIAMGNSGEQRFAAQLEAWTSAEDSVLAEAAEWALKRINGS